MTSLLRRVKAWLPARGHAVRCSASVLDRPPPQQALRLPSLQLFSTGPQGHPEDLPSADSVLSDLPLVQLPTLQRPPDSEDQTSSADPNTALPAPQMQPASEALSTRVVVVGVDPDSNGAIAVATWDAEDLNAQVDLASMQLEVYDMPCVEVTLQKKNKATGKPVKRRWLDMDGARRLIQSILNKHAQPALSNQHDSHGALGPPWGQDGSVMPPGMDSGAAARAPRPVELRAFLETTPTIPFNSSPRTLATQLHAVGGWHGLLSMAGFQASTIPATVWKRDLSLVGLDKTGSVALALQLWPDQARLLSRKKDHGRAEAMLIVAWALGATRPAPSAGLARSGSSSTRSRKKTKTPASANAAALRQVLLTRAGISASPAPTPAASSGAPDPVTVSGNTADDGLDVTSGSPVSADSTSVEDLSGGLTQAGVGSVGVEVDEDGIGVVTVADEEQDGVSSPTLTAEQLAEMRQRERDQMRALVEERSAWPVVMGSLRPARATDGYGNPVPTNPAASILPVSALPPTDKSGGRRRKARSSSDADSGSDTETSAVPTTRAARQRGKRKQTPVSSTDTVLSPSELLQLVQGTSAASQQTDDVSSDCVSSTQGDPGIPGGVVPGSSNGGGQALPAKRRGRSKQEGAAVSPTAARSLHCGCDAEQATGLEASDVPCVKRGRGRPRKDRGV